MRFCVCGRADSQAPEDLDDLREALRDVIERKKDLARACATDPRLLSDVRDLREQELELRQRLTRASYENSAKTQPHPGSRS